MTNSMRAGVAAVALLAAAVSGCQRPAARPATDTGKIAEAVKADQVQLVSDFNAHDAAKFSSHTTDDFVGMEHGAANVVGSDAELSSTKKAFAADPSAHLVVTNGAVEVAASGDMAVYRAAYAFTGTDPSGKPIAESGNYVAGYKAGADGDWKIVWSVVSDAPAPAASS